MRWFKDHKITATILIILLIFGIILFTSYQLRDQENVIGQVATSITTTVQKPFAALGKLIDDGISNPFVPEDIAEENKELKAKIRELENQLIKERLSQAELDDLSAISEMLKYNQLEQSYEFVTADVISMDGSNYFNVFTIGLGSDNGVKVDSVVVSGNGVVGRVISTTDKTAKVIGIIDETNKISFQIFRDMTLLGVCQGDGAGGMQGELLDDKAIVKKGDKLVTTGISDVYPEGLVIGKVTKVEWTHDSPLKTVTVEPAVDFNSIRRVTVLI